MMNEAIKKIQAQLGVAVDGIWGSRSQAALEQALKEGKPVKLTDNFYLSELLVSNTATRLGINNIPDGNIIRNLSESAENLWQPVRDLLGKPMLISSGYRSPAVNARVGGSRTSAHCYGYAIDFTCPSFGTPLEIARFLAKELPKHNIKYDQIIMEFGRWVHLAYKNGAGEQRGKNTTAKKVNGKTVYVGGV